MPVKIRRFSSRRERPDHAFLAETLSDAKSYDRTELRYKETINPDENRWELCSRVLARNDVIAKLAESW